MNETIKKRLKSKVVWAAVLAQILLIALLLAPQFADYIKVIGGALLEIVALFGFVNNPTDSENF